MGSVKAGTRPPWVGLGAAVWVQIAAGNAYNFPLYSHSLKSVLGFCNFVGRLGGGVVSEYFVRTRKVPRTLGMTLTQIVMIFVYLLLAFGLDGTLYIATALLGICYGVQFSVMIPTVSELFGLQNFGLFFNFISLGNPIGAFLFSGLLAGYVYDAEVNKQQHGLNLLAASSAACIGPSCFMLTFLVLAGLCVLGAVCSLILSVRIKPVYHMLYADGSFRLPQPDDH
uniref:NFD4 C-terminal domain-containing protein n=1 Tax=Kalanchoe fedtschenkoi TaxID=63787 RepID=A0A7N0RG17_KALFE